MKKFIKWLSIIALILVLVVQQIEIAALAQHQVILQERNEKLIQVVGMILKGLNEEVEIKKPKNPPVHSPKKVQISIDISPKPAKIEL